MSHPSLSLRAEHRAQECAAQGCIGQDAHISGHMLIHNTSFLIVYSKLICYHFLALEILTWDIMNNLYNRLLAIIYIAHIEIHFNSVDLTAVYVVKFSNVI